MSELQPTKREPLLFRTRASALPGCKHTGHLYGGYRMLTADAKRVDQTKHGQQSLFNSLVHDHDRNRRAHYLTCTKCGWYTESEISHRPWFCWCGWPAAAAKAKQKQKQ